MMKIMVKIEIEIEIRRKLKDTFLLFEINFFLYKSIIHSFRNMYKEERRRRKRRKYELKLKRNKNK